MIEQAIQSILKILNWFKTKEAEEIISKVIDRARKDGILLESISQGGD